MPATKPDLRGITPGSPEWRVALGMPVNDDPSEDDTPSGSDMVPAFEYETEEETPADRVARMLQGSSNDDRAILRIYRIIGPNKFSYCEEMTPAQFELESYAGIREKWGGGEFQLRLNGIHPTRPNAKGGPLFCVLAKENVLIEASKNPPASAVPSELATMLKSMNDNQAAMLKALTEKPPAIDPLAQLKQTMELMQLAKQLGGETKGNGGGMKEFMETFRSFKEMQEEMGGGGDGKKDESDLAALVGLAKPIVDMVSQQPRTNQQALPAPVRLPASMANARPPQQLASSDPVGHSQARTDADADSQAATAPETPDDLGEDPMMAFAMLKLRGTMQVLQKFAEKKAPPEDAAGFAYDELPEEILDELEKDTWFDALKLMMPEAAQYQEWLTQVRTLILQYMKEDAEPDEGGAP